MSGHIGKARFNGKRNNKAVQVFSSTIINKQKKEISVYATHGPLNDYYLTDEASHTRFIQFPK